MKKVTDLILSKETAAYLQKKILDKVTFTHTTSTFSEKFFFPDDAVEKVFSTSFRSLKELGLMTKVKFEVKRNLQVLSGKKYDANNVQYFDYSGVQFDALEVGEIVEYKNTIEIDISAAYYYAALNLKLLSPETIEKCLLLQKSKRLAILGAIAAKKIVTEYVEGVIKQQVVNEVFVDSICVTNNELRSAWFAICKNVDDCMKCCKDIAGKNFLFYYVDGIYINNNSKTVTAIENQILKTGFRFKKTPVEKFEVIRTDKNYLLNIYKNGKENPKEFKIRRKQIKYLLLK